MTRALLPALVLATSLAGLACDGHDVAVFDTPAAGGSAGSSGAPGSLSATPGGAAGSLTAPAAGNDGGGSSDGAAPGSAGVAGSPSATPGGMGGGGMPGRGGRPPPTPCTSDLDCSGWVCAKDGCQGTSGFCEPPAIFCPPDPSPVCGCDGVTYWNDCIRRQAGAQQAAPEQCRATASACEVGSDCTVPNASCSHLVAPGEMCGQGMGSCWVLPPACAASSDTHLWQECKTPDAPPSSCVETCDAIRSEKPFAPPHGGMTCN